MKNKGFTLVELLAVIVVLSIIALIGYSTVGNIISSSQDSSNKITIKNYAEAVDQAIFLSEMNNKEIDLTSPDWFKENVKFEKSKVECEYATYDKTSSLYGCKINSGDKKYCYINNEVTECNENKLSKIYGNSIQNGTPTPTSPVEIQSVGNKTKNLCNVVDGNDIAYTDYNEYTIENGTINFNGKTLVGIICKVNPNTTYTISAKSTDLGIEQRIREYNAKPTNFDTNLIKQTYSATFRASNSGKVTTSETTKYVLIVYYGNADKAGARVYDIQLEEGNTATSYEPYGYKIPITVSNGSTSNTTNIYLKEPLRKIGDTADYLDLVNKKVVRNIKEIVFDGLTTGKKITNVTTTTSNTYYAYINNLNGVTGDKNVLINSHFKSITSYKEGNSYITNNGTALVMFNTNQAINTTSLWNNWLNEQYTNSTPVVVDYVLSKEEEESIEVPSIPELEKGQNCEDFYKVNGATVECGY